MVTLALPKAWLLFRWLPDDYFCTEMNICTICNTFAAPSTYLLLVGDSLDATLVCNDYSRKQNLTTDKDPWAIFKHSLKILRNARASREAWIQTILLIKKISFNFALFKSSDKLFSWLKLFLHCPLFKCQRRPCQTYQTVKARFESYSISFQFRFVLHKIPEIKLLVKSILQFVIWPVYPWGS